MKLGSCYRLLFPYLVAAWGIFGEALDDGLWSQGDIHSHSQSQFQQQLTMGEARSESPGTPTDLNTKSLDFCPPLNHIPGEIPYLGPDYSRADKTVLEILDSHAQTQRFASLLRQFPNLATRLEQPEINSTVWAPVDTADVPAGCQGELLLACLSNHISPRWVPTIREMTMPNTPTLLRPGTLNGEARVHVSVSISSQTADGEANTRSTSVMLNRHSRILQHDIMAKNGVIHIIDEYLPPLRSMSSFLEFLPAERFGLLQQAMQRTGFAQEMAEGKLYGGTLFAPDDTAFRRLDDDRRQFLFSQDGKADLATLLRGHLVPNRTLFSNAFYDVETSKSGLAAAIVQDQTQPPGIEGHETIKLSQSYQVTIGSNCYKVPWGRRRFLLPTLMEGRTLAVDVARAGGLIEIFLPGGTRVKVMDFLCNDGIVHVVDGVLESDSSL